MSIQQIRIDDIDGTPGATQVLFGWEGQVYTIDLSEDNRAKLRQAIEPFLSHAEITSMNKFALTAKPTVKKAPSKASMNGKVTSKIAPMGADGYRSGVDYDPVHLKHWMERQGMQLTRGRPAAALIEKYLADQSHG